MSKMRTIAVANGGDSALGLNAVMRSVVCSAINTHDSRANGTNFGDNP